MTKIISDQAVKRTPLSRDARMMAAQGIVLMCCHALAMLMRPLAWMARHVTNAPPFRVLKGVLQGMLHKATCHSRGRDTTSNTIGRDD